MVSYRAKGRSQHPTESKKPETAPADLWVPTALGWLPVVTEMDLLRARQIVCALMPLKRLSSEHAEIVARAIAESIAGGRKQGLEMAEVDLEA